jgi:hypothetical protein
MKRRLFWGSLASAASLTAIWAAVNYAPAPQNGPTTYASIGKFGPVQNWPLMPIHFVVLPDGRALSYGTDQNGKQGATMIYDVWDPAKGFGADAHLTLPNTVTTDLFCTGAVLLSDGTGRALLTGGDLIVDGERNGSSPDINLFDGRDNKLTKFERPMNKPRWYPTMMTLPSGDILVAGGRISRKEYTGEVEIYRRDGSWGTLPQAYSDGAFGVNNWSYPRMWPIQNDKVFVLTTAGEMFTLDMKQGGKPTKLDIDPKVVGNGHSYLPSVQYRPGKILAARVGPKVEIIDVNGARPSITRLDVHDLARSSSNLTVMPDGKVLWTGGSLRDASEKWYVMANRTTRIWDPDTNTWAWGPIAAKMRMYHSTVTVLPDATLLTGGGGAPGPVNNTNVQVYYPPYLFKKDDSGELAPRPNISKGPDTAHLGQKIHLSVKAQGISKVTLLKTPATTHTLSFDQSFSPLSWQETSPGEIDVNLPDQGHVMPPGYYYVFVFDAQGVPSKAKTFLVSPP